jgi:hypothetical protein
VEEQLFTPLAFHKNRIALLDPPVLKKSADQGAFTFIHPGQKRRF